MQDILNGVFQYPTTQLMKVLQFTRQLAAGAGDVSYTGFGFCPKVVIILFGLTGGAYQIGFSAFDVAKTNLCIHLLTTALAEAPAVIVSLIETAATALQTAVVKSIDSNGFTLTWTKVGTPSATGYLTVIAFG